MNILNEIEVNRAPTHMTRTPSNTLSREARQSMGKYTERKKAKGEALKQQFDWRNTTYRSGDGDHTAQVPRAGSLVAFSLPSRGNRT
jgi:hypothetical protein